MNTALLNEADLATTRDTYDNFAELAAHETEGVAWARELRPAPGSDLAHIAVHGGGIEVGTTEAANAAAGDSHNYYSFRGKKKASSNRDLHVTSSHFDEPRCVALQHSMVRTVSWHGFHSTQKITEVGGLDDQFKMWVKRSLQHAGFAVTDAAVERAGRNPQNICNRNLSGYGVQLELSTAQRAAFFRNGDMSASNRQHTTEEFTHYIEAVQLAYRRLRA
ncbi:poly-gamma-glutamate hydrolase family protein [Streptomyces sp. S.PB5]|uniref:poly-gamma-glutamate hydrolase family protein n=1 Tax=Streptomyces sp. S.PB5 TaxID=3020844 RepID=UPI0025B1B1ED|nr:poly-gamma-glutamate hydrolase family protein [Streptomyces sp. S.PB5]MDN3023944.1 poly-gamma-glutamate hydrolase family protein [Streptomyces sp. S.PB5]